jgi:hypothetical protein
MNIHECVTVVQLIGMKDTEECLPPFRVPFVPRLRYGRDRSKGIVVTAWTCPMFQDHFSFDFHGCFLKNRQYLNVPNFTKGFSLANKETSSLNWSRESHAPERQQGQKPQGAGCLRYPQNVMGQPWYIMVYQSTSYGISWYIMVYWLPLLSLSQPIMVAVGLNGLGGAAFVSRAPGAIDFACRRVCKNWRTARTVDLFRDQILKVMLDKCTNYYYIDITI